MIEKLAYTVNESCDALGIRRTTFYKLVKANALKPFKLGGRTLVDVEELRRLVKETQQDLDTF